MNYGYKKIKAMTLKGRIVQPPKTGLKCTSAAAPTLQQTVACTILPFNIETPRSSRPTSSVYLL